MIDMENIKRSLEDRERGKAILLWLIEYEMSSSWLTYFSSGTWIARYYNWKVNRKLKRLIKYHQFKDSQKVNQ